MFLSDINTPFERGKCKCLQIQAQASVGNTLLPFQSGKVTQLFHLVPFFPTLLHLSWLFKILHAYFLLAAVSQFFGFPIWSVLLATLLHCAACSCHLLFSCHYTESSQDEVVSLLKRFLETCVCQTPTRYLGRWAFASSSSLIILKKNKYWMKGSLLFSRALAFLLSFLLTSNSAAWAFLSSCPALLSCYHPLIRSCLKLACGNCRAGLISPASSVRGWHSFEWFWKK